MKIRQMQTGLLLASSLILLAASTGCQSTGTTANYNPFARLLDIGKTEAKESGDDLAGIEFGQPVRMAVLWNETAITPPDGGQSTRGFGGRVYFYDAQNNPIRVNGQLHVYAYDDTNDRNESQRVPDREYIFKPEKLQARFSETGIGASYNLWLPWDKVGGFQKRISLLPVFKPADGFLVRSEQSLAILPGKEPENTIEEFTPGRSMVRHVNAVIDGNDSIKGSLIDGKADISPRRKATTIRVPNRLANRMRQANRPVRPSSLSNAQVAKNNDRRNVGTTADASAAAVETATALNSAPAASMNQAASSTGSRTTFGAPGSLK